MAERIYVVKHKESRKKNACKSQEVDFCGTYTLIEEDNLPRYETLRWYLEIIGLDFVEGIKVVNNIPKLYNET